MPSAAARSPSRSGPERSTVDSAANWVGVRPASSCLRSRRESRAMATRSRVTSITPDSVSIRLSPAADGLIVVSRAMHEDYALHHPPRTLEQWRRGMAGRDCLGRRKKIVTMAPSVSYSITARLEVASHGRAVSEITRAVEHAGGVVTALDVSSGQRGKLRVDVTCAATDTAHAEALVAAMAAIPGVTLHKVSDRTFLLHLGGKIEMRS